MRPAPDGLHRFYHIRDGDKKAMIAVTGTGTTGIMLMAGPWSLLSICPDVAAEMLRESRLMGHTIERRTTTRAQRHDQFLRFMGRVAAGEDKIDALISEASESD